MSEPEGPRCLPALSRCLTRTCGALRGRTSLAKTEFPARSSCETAAVSLGLLLDRDGRFTRQTLGEILHHLLELSPVSRNIVELIKALALRVLARA
ncbi:hypothetical protein SDC9_88004 [bioreactor metagenome]|uniref:Uncharacterized protein n=1 Tax=bioreactor metagenome TaxID=1076179 RepID=A0A644ZKF5_9ZZZZ